MKKIALLLLLLLFFTACKNEEKETETPTLVSQLSPKHDDELVIVATNDFHAALQRAEGLASIIR